MKIATMWSLFKNINLMSGSFSDSKLKPINHVYILAQQILLKSIIIEKCQRDDQQMLKVTFLLILDF